MCATQDKPKTGNYERSVIALLQNYGTAMEAFALATAGSPVGMEATMRVARDAARDVLFAALGREPTLEELAQLPPLYEAPVSCVALDDLESSNDQDDDEDGSNH